jgi:hypothetical protein
MLTGTVCTLISAAGLGVAFLVARRRRYALALRVAAVALLPVGLAMTGVVQFVSHITFDPVAWAGFGVLGGSALLYLVARLADGRRRQGGAAADSGGATPALPASRRREAGSTPRGSSAADDFSDIEAILKKHGI